METLEYKYQKRSAYEIPRKRCNPFYEDEEIDEESQPTPVNEPGNLSKEEIKRIYKDRSLTLEQKMEKTLTPEQMKKVQHRMKKITAVYLIMSLISFIIGVGITVVLKVGILPIDSLMQSILLAVTLGLFAFSAMFSGANIFITARRRWRNIRMMVFSIIIAALALSALVFAGFVPFF